MRASAPVIWASKVSCVVSTIGTGSSGLRARWISDSIDVAKYARDGTLLWATSAGGASNDSGFGVATDHRGNIYVTGSFRGTATFGAGEANETVLEAMAIEDVFVAKY
jgi:hypothetical protein